MNDDRRFVARHVAALPKSGIRDFFAIVSQMRDAVSLGIGEPDFVTPFSIREAAMAALEKGRTSYTDNRGLLALREEISRYVARNYGPEYRPDDEILVTIGVSEALDILLRAVLNPGDKVLYHEPCYVSYAPSVALCHAVPVPVRTSARDAWALDPAASAPPGSPAARSSSSTSPPTPPAAPPTGPSSRPSPPSPSRRTCWSPPTRSTPSSPMRATTSPSPPCPGCASAPSSSTASPRPSR